jgi:tryptophan-rich sensory protein
MAVQMKRREFIGLMGWLGLTFAASAVGAIASVNASEFYGLLQQPGWAPPPWLFGPVWTVLYALMAIAAWLVWRPEGFRAKSLPLGLFLAQLALNSLWSWLFFTWHLGGLAFSEILLLWLLILATVITFWRVRPIAGVLLVPYLGWVTFAAALNYTLWRLNPLTL